MIQFSNGKINLGLRVIRKREDHFHEIETLFYPIPIFDILEIVPSKNLNAFSYSGISIPGNEQENLCQKAYQLLKKDFPSLSAIQLHLHKVIPPGSGLGAGSGNGAHTLSILNQIFNLGLTMERLEKYAARLGSDCPFFIKNIPALARGRGEILEPLPLSLKGKFLLIVVPTQKIETAAAFQWVEPKIAERSIKEIVQMPVAQWSNFLFNDFEKPVFERYPELASIKERLMTNGALYASLSGTGSALYGIFDQQKDISFKEDTALVSWVTMD